MQQLLLLGRATKDAEVLESKQGKKYAKFGMAVNEYMGKEKGSTAYFYDVLIFNKSVPKADRIKKGDLIILNGKPNAEAYISKEGEAKAKMIVYAKTWNLIK